jgi:hypothetical protein
MDQYVIIRSKVFESTEKFQKKVNEQARKGYKAVNIAGMEGGYVVLMERVG